MKNVKDFGAKGDGVTLDTAAIQSAIDSGGMVYFPQGTYISGTIYLKSHGGIYLEKGAKIRASHNHSDYNAPDFCPQNRVFPSEFMAGTHLICAVEQEDIVITGFGVVDGDSHYWVNEKYMHANTRFFNHPPAEANRPAQMIFFAECKNIRVIDVNLINSPFWHLFFHGCTDVTVKGLHISGERMQWVNDGIDIDCCSRVTVSDCVIDTGDDGIAVRAVGKPLVAKDAVCEDVSISNCTITSYVDHGIRIGVGNGIIRNCSFSNITIKDSLLGIGITCRFSPNGDAVSVENIRFSDVTVKALCALDVKISNNPAHPPLKAPNYLRGITFENSCIDTERCCYILGFHDLCTSDIAFCNTKFLYTPEDPKNERFNLKWSGIDHTDAVIYTEKTKDITFSDCRFVKNAPLVRDITLVDCEKPVLFNTDAVIE